MQNIIYFHKYRYNTFIFTNFITGVTFIILIGGKNRGILEVKK